MRFVQEGRYTAEAALGGAGGPYPAHNPGPMARRGPGG
jgi:hypothetical protein